MLVDSFLMYFLQTFLQSFTFFFYILLENNIKMLKKIISAVERHAKHLFAGQNTQLGIITVAIFACFTMGISLEIRISETKSNQAALSSKGFPFKIPFLRWT